MYFWIMLRNFKQPMFIVFLIIAAILWYTNKLSHTYTASVIVPVKVENSFDAGNWINNGDLNLLCRIQADGYKILMYKFRLEPAVIIPSSMLEMKLSDTTSYNYSIDIASLKRAMDNNLTGISLLSIQEPSITIEVVPMAEKVVPVKTRLSLSFDRQYMQIGRVEVSPSTVTIKAPKNIVDTISVIYTYPQRISNINTNLRNRVDLIPIEGVVMSAERVYYNIYCSEFTEMNARLPIDIRNAPDSLHPIVMPAQVDIQMNIALSGYEALTHRSLRPYIDYNDMASNLSDKFRVRIDSLPVTATIKEMVPQYVNLYFEKSR